MAHWRRRTCGRVISLQYGSPLTTFSPSRSFFGDKGIPFTHKISGVNYAKVDREVGTHRRKFRLCRGRNYNFTNTCEEVSIRTISTILPAKGEISGIEIFFIGYIVRASNKGARKKAKVEEKQFETLNKETATHIGIREAEDWFRPIDLAKECDIYISSRSGSHKEIPITYGYTQDPFKNRSQTLNQRLKRTIPNILKEKIKIALYAVIHLIAQETRMVEVKPINLSLNQHSPGLSVRTAISPTLTEEFIIHPSVCSEIKKLGHAKSDVLLSESGSSLGVHFNSSVSFPNVSFSNVIENSSYDLPHVKNFNTRNDLSSLIKDYKLLCKKANGAMKTSSVEFISRSPNPLPMKSKHHRFVLLRRIFEPWQWKRRKKRNRFEQTSRTLQRKISMRSSKDQLVKKDVLMPVKHNVFLWNLPDVEEVPSHDGETV
ncbi:phosphatase and actin regulator 2 [Trichonephila clavipes]|nr:phosphatase and actin regulator 2 [Trichonephila clavipes]